MFAYSLARDLHMTVNPLLENMDVEEFMGWVAYHTIKNEEQENEAGGPSHTNREMTPAEEQKEMCALYRCNVIEKKNSLILHA